MFARLAPHEEEFDFCWLAVVHECMNLAKQEPLGALGDTQIDGFQDTVATQRCSTFVIA